MGEIQLLLVTSTSHVTDQEAQALTDHGYRTGTGCSIIRGKNHPPQNRLHLHLLIKVAGDELSICSFRYAIDGYVHASQALESEEVFEDRLGKVLLNPLHVEIGEPPGLIHLDRRPQIDRRVERRVSSRQVGFDLRG